jgi:ribosomal silencing factor RsfS
LGRIARQTKAIWDEVHERLKHEGPASFLDGRRRERGQLDHRRLPRHGAARLHAEARDYYRLEDLRGDVPSVPVEAASPTA